MAFSATIEDVFSISGKGTVLWLTAVIGEPAEGDRFQTEIGEATVLAIGKPGIRSRACLTGKEVPPCGGILTDLPMPEAKSLHKTTIETVEGEL